MLNYTNKIASSLLIAAGLFVLPITSSAMHSSIEDAQQLKNKIIYHANLHENSKNKSAKTIKLPVSRGFDQQRTCLCWSYAFFNALESLYLIKHENLELELSRGAMQYINLQDRIDLKIDGIEDHLDPSLYKGCWSEGGTPLSAEYLLKNYGALPYNAYHDIISPPYYSNLYYSIFVDDTTPPEKRALADSLLVAYFADTIPTTTHYNGATLSRLDFARQIMPEGSWNTYSISKDGSEYIAKALDPDARRDEQTYFIPKEKFIQKINASLAGNRPVIYANSSHALLIYGADYNKKDEPIRFYIKDSYAIPGYFYKADFNHALQEVTAITVLEDQ